VYSRFVRPIVFCIVGVFAGLALSGCLGGLTAEREKLPVPLEITLAAMQDVNPAASGRPSPVVVRIFELANESRFQTVDYFALMGQGPVTLEGDVLSTEEYTLLPGEVRIVRKRATLQSKFLGVVAGYRDLGSSAWRAITPLPEPYLAGRLWSSSESPTKKLTVVLGKSGVTIRDEDSSKKAGGDAGTSGHIAAIDGAERNVASLK